MSEHCPTCGCPVKVVCNDKDLGGDGCTNHYEPVMDENVRRLVEMSQRAAAYLELGARKKNPSELGKAVLDCLDAALAPFEEEEVKAFAQRTAWRCCVKSARKAKGEG